MNPLTERFFAVYQSTLISTVKFVSNWCLSVQGETTLNGIALDEQGLTVSSAISFPGMVSINDCLTFRDTLELRTMHTTSSTWLFTPQTTMSPL